MSTHNGPLSPIERMVDIACGFDRANYLPPPKVMLRCPTCGRTKQVDKDETDPANTATVEVECDKHDSGFETIHYFDADGKEITLKP